VLHNVYKLKRDSKNMGSEASINSGVLSFCVSMYIAYYSYKLALFYNILEI
jgi:hypothetical protein